MYGHKTRHGRKEGGTIKGKCGNGEADSPFTESCKRTHKVRCSMGYYLVSPGRKALNLGRWEGRR